MFGIKKFRALRARKKVSVNFCKISKPIQPDFSECNLFYGWIVFRLKELFYRNNLRDEKKTQIKWRYHAVSVTVPCDGT